MPLLKNVLTEPMGIRTNDLFPVKEDIDRMQHYMHDKMGIGSIIDVDSFVDDRFANKACKDRVSSMQRSVIYQTSDRAMEILNKHSADDKEHTTKTLLDLEGKYLMISLNEQPFGIDILKIREIIKMVPIRSVPKSPKFVCGIINLRGKVVPVVDLRLVMGMNKSEQKDKSG